MASIYSNDMREVMDGLAEAVKAAGKDDEFFYMAIKSQSLALRLQVVTLDDIAYETCPYAWMFLQDFDELEHVDQIIVQNSFVDLYKDGMMLLGRDIIAELNPGRSKGYIEFIRDGFQDGELYSDERRREFMDIIREIPHMKRAEELCAALEEIGGDFSHPEADAELDRLKKRARSFTPTVIREKVLQKRIKV